MEDSSGEWLTYAEAGDRLGVSPEAVRAKAARKRMAAGKSAMTGWRAFGFPAMSTRPVTCR
jgi:hypothetical protein